VEPVTLEADLAVRKAKPLKGLVEQVMIVDLDRHRSCGDVQDGGELVLGHPVDRDTGELGLGDDLVGNLRSCSSRCRVMFDELVARFSSDERATPGEWTRSNQHKRVRQIPIKVSQNGHDSGAPYHRQSLPPP